MVPKTESDTLQYNSHDTRQVELAGPNAKSSKRDIQIGIADNNKQNKYMSG
jgi:hypothetical protein